MATRTFDVAELTFGVEIECYLPHRALADMGQVGYHRHGQAAGLPEGWSSTRDGSLDAAPAGMAGTEIVSPVLKGADGIRQIVEVCRRLQALGARVNASCGFHVHVGIGFDPERIGRLVCLVARHEQALFAVTGTRSRELGTYCQPIKGSHTYTSRFRDKTHEVKDRTDLPAYRYFTLNLSNLAEDRRPTAEFRVFSGTINATKAVMNVRLCLALVERAVTMSRAAKWDITYRKVSKVGAGQNALWNLLGEIGWQGRYVPACGVVGDDSAPELAACVAEAKRLAAKYDGGAAD
jgi:hypothetical protein